MTPAISTKNVPQYPAFAFHGLFHASFPVKATNAHPTGDRASWGIVGVPFWNIGT